MTEPFEDGVARPRAEPLFNVPWTVLALVGVLIGAHAARTGLKIDPDTFALTSETLAAGRWSGLLSHLFVHGSWAHVLMNSIFIVAFGTPVARFLGSGARGSSLFLTFFLVCGVAAGLAFAGLMETLHTVGVGPPYWAMIGASGAASGFMGAAARLIEGRGRLGPIGGRTVWGMTIGWILVNAILGLTGLTPGTAGAPVAWEAHIFGYFAGLLFIGPFARLAGVRRPSAVHEEMTR
jgi:membrane associated rhomboid family serine protease